MTKPYRFTMHGTAGGGQTWTATGVVTCEFHNSLTAAMGVAFDQLTNGTAVYGKPGVGCHGPYDIHRVQIEAVPQ